MKLTVQGHEAYAYTGGKAFDAALPCVVFLHGALNDHGVWTLLARWCAHQGAEVTVADTREQPPQLAALQATCVIH